MNQAVGYVRVSTEEQAREGVSLEAQEERLRVYATLTGLELQKVYAEEGVSGSVPLAERPIGRELVATIRKQRSDVVALRLDRLFRDASDALEQTRAWDRQGVALHLVDMGGSTLNTASAMGRLFLTMTAAFAELERNLISERTAGAMAHKRARLEVYGHAPLGYVRNGEKLEQVAEELDLVAKIRAMRADGSMSLRAIAESLNVEGVPTKQRGRWDHSTIRYVLRNPVYQEAPS